MSILNKSVLDVMTESAEIEDFILNDLFDDEVEKELDAEISDIEELEESFKYEAEMIPVFKKEDKFFVEFTDLYKLVECGDCDDEEDALEDIITANDDEGMTLENTFVVIESDDYMYSIIDEIKSSIKSASGVDKKTGKAKLVKAKDAFANLKNKGIKLVKKKSTGKKKKK